ncbi:hypothetical protein GQ54DRAFT_339220 [Martensiomyces pterosporus]|nr:hypothetical protein GQ54DRAFT_339220 [Martensiomyces pterosporus]
MLALLLSSKRGFKCRLIEVSRGTGSWIPRSASGRSYSSTTSPTLEFILWETAENISRGICALCRDAVGKWSGVSLYADSEPEPYLEAADTSCLMRLTTGAGDNVREEEEEFYWPVFATTTLATPEALASGSGVVKLPLAADNETARAGMTPSSGTATAAAPTKGNCNLQVTGFRWITPVTTAAAPLPIASIWIPRSASGRSYSSTTSPTLEFILWETAENISRGICALCRDAVGKWSGVSLYADSEPEPYLEAADTSCLMRLTTGAGDNVREEEEEFYWPVFATTTLATPEALASGSGVVKLPLAADNETARAGMTPSSGTATAAAPTKGDFNLQVTGFRWITPVTTAAAPLPIASM